MIYLKKRFLMLFVLMCAIYLPGCGSKPVKKAVVSEHSMKIWITPQYAPSKLAGYPYIEVPVRSNQLADKQQYAENSVE